MSVLADEFRRRSDEVEMSLRALETAVRCGYGRDAICERLTDCSVALSHLAEETNRLAKQAGQGRKLVTRVEDERESQGSDGREELRSEHEIAMLGHDDSPGENDELSVAARELAVLVKGAPMQDGARLLQDRMADQRRHVRLTTIRAVFRAFWHGAGTPWQMMLNGVAISRRYVQSYIPGMTQTEVSRLLGETRAATSARESRLHDAMLLKWGVKNPKAADAGLKSPAACAHYKQSNGKSKSRKRGERRKKLQRAFQAAASSARDSAEFEEQKNHKTKREA